MINVILLQASQGGGMGQYGQIILFAAIGLVFYFFMIRPQQKKQKDGRKFLGELKKGDQIVTLGGLHGKVVEIDDATITLDVDRGTKLKFEKSSVSHELSKKYAMNKK